MRSYAIEFLAPENATLEAKAKVVVKGTADIGSVTLSLDGKDCTNGRCGFQAKKGETYRLLAAARLSSLGELCIMVARPPAFQRRPPYRPDVSLFQLGRALAKIGSPVIGLIPG